MTVPRRSTVGADALSAETRIVQCYAMGRDGWRICIETETVLTTDATAFRLTGELRAYENDALVRTRTWDDEDRALSSVGSVSKVRTE